MKRMEIDLSKMMTGDEWYFLHTPEMYYAIHGSENPDPEQIALAALRQARREFERQRRYELAQVQAEKAEDYTVNIKSNVRL